VDKKIKDDPDPLILTMQIILRRLDQHDEKLQIIEEKVSTNRKLLYLIISGIFGIIAALLSLKP